MGSVHVVIVCYAVGVCHFSADSQCFGTTHHSIPFLMLIDNYVNYI